MVKTRAKLSCLCSSTHQDLSICSIGAKQCNAQRNAEVNIMVSGLQRGRWLLSLLYNTAHNRHCGQLRAWLKQDESAKRCGEAGQDELLLLRPAVRDSTQGPRQSGHVQRLAFCAELIHRRYQFPGSFALRSRPNFGSFALPTIWIRSSVPAPCLEKKGSTGFNTHRFQPVIVSETLA